jgi:hypothetical protein
MARELLAAQIHAHRTPETDRSSPEFRAYFETMRTITNHVLGPEIRDPAVAVRFDQFALAMSRLAGFLLVMTATMMPDDAADLANILSQSSEEKVIRFLGTFNTWLAKQDEERP